MSASVAPGPDPLADAVLAAQLCAIDPVGLGGMALRGGDDARDEVIATLRAGLTADAPMRRLPSGTDDAALLGGIDLTATLALGGPVRQQGLLAAVDGGLLILPMAERLSDATAAQIAAVVDAGSVEGASTRFVLVALDDGREVEERLPTVVAERLAFWIDLSNAGAGKWAPPPVSRSPAPPAGPGPIASEDQIGALVATAEALGVGSARASLFALRAARASARLDGRTAIADEDVALAARLVLGPRATRLPAPAEGEPEADPPPPDQDGGEEERGDPGRLDDVVLAAVLAALPPDVLARLAAGPSRRAPARTHGGGERRKSGARGRPLGARAGIPGGGRRLSVIDTLRAAAPWQRLRGGEVGHVRIRRDDLRIRRFETRAEAVTIFAVDASGSAALARLAEAKGAVELLLAQAYVKRAQVALLAFRGTAAELLLPPTRSLARARRALADLPGGGGTPLAAGLHAARELAEASRKRARTPFLVVLTDGRANVGVDGGTDRGAAQAEAEAAARAIGAARFAGAFIDISPRPRPEGAVLAAAMGARYLPLPRADAATMHAAVLDAQRQ